MAEQIFLSDSRTAVDRKYVGMAAPSNLSMLRVVRSEASMANTMPP